MEFKDFSKNCLNFLLVQLSQHFLCYHQQEYFLLQIINGKKFVNTAPLSPSSFCLAASSTSAPVIVILPLTSMYASLWSHKLDFNIMVLNLMSLLVLYTPLDLSLVSIQFLVQNLDNWFDVLSNRFIIFSCYITILLY